MEQEFRRISATKSFEEAEVKPNLIQTGCCPLCGNLSYLIGLPLLKLAPHACHEIDCWDEIKLGTFASASFLVVSKLPDMHEILVLTSDLEYVYGSRKGICWECYDGALCPSERKYLAARPPLTWDEGFPWRKAKFCCSSGYSVEYPVWSEDPLTPIHRPIPRALLAVLEGS